VKFVFSTTLRLQQLEFPKPATTFEEVAVGAVCCLNSHEEKEMVPQGPHLMDLKRLRVEPVSCNCTGAVNSSSQRVVPRCLASYSPPTAIHSQVFLARDSGITREVHLVMRISCGSRAVARTDLIGAISRRRNVSPSAKSRNSWLLPCLE
jgi:hypothetical protein